MQKALEQIKVIVVGDSSVGKSSILFRFVNNEFNEFSEATLGAAFISKVHTYGSNKSVRFQVWDTAGQEKYKSIAPIYYKESQVALCVYDITRKESFLVLKTWVEELRNKGPAQLLLVVVGNKIDRTDDEVVTYQEAKDYAQSLGALFKLTSAKDGKGINELFNSVAERLEQLKAMRSLGAGRESVRLANNAQKKKQGGCCAKKER